MIDLTVTRKICDVDLAGEVGQSRAIMVEHGLSRRRGQIVELGRRIDGRPGASPSWAPAETPLQGIREKTILGRRSVIGRVARREPSKHVP